MAHAAHRTEGVGWGAARIRRLLNPGTRRVGPTAASVEALRSAGMALHGDHGRWDGPGGLCLHRPPEAPWARRRALLDTWRRAKWGRIARPRQDFAVARDADLAARAKEARRARQPDHASALRMFLLGDAVPKTVAPLWIGVALCPGGNSLASEVGVPAGVQSGRELVPPSGRRLGACVPWPPQGASPGTLAWRRGGRTCWPVPPLRLASWGRNVMDGADPLLAAGVWAVVLADTTGQVLRVVTGEVAVEQTTPRAELHAALWVAEGAAGAIPLSQTLGISAWVRRRWAAPRTARPPARSLGVGMGSPPSGVPPGVRWVPTLPSVAWNDRAAERHLHVRLFPGAMWHPSMCQRMWSLSGARARERPPAREKRPRRDDARPGQAKRHTELSTRKRT